VHREEDEDVVQSCLAATHGAFRLEYILPQVHLFFVGIFLGGFFSDPEKSPFLGRDQKVAFELRATVSSRPSRFFRGK
jgi:hypothetical protein